MNKTIIYSLSAVIIIILAANLIVPFAALFFQYMGRNSANDQKDVSNNVPVEILLSTKSNDIYHPDDQITMANGESYPFITKSGILLVPDNKYSNNVSTWVSIVSLTLSLITFILLVIYIIRFVMKISQGKIFTKDNLKLLNIIAYCLLAIAFFDICGGISQEFVVQPLKASNPEIELSSNWEIPWSNLLLGFSILLIAQIWKRGISLQEDNKLTI